MNKVKNIFLGILKFFLSSLRYTCFIYGIFYFLAVISFLNDNLDFDFSVLKNASSEELKLMLKLMLRNFITLGILFAILEYSYKHFLRESLRELCSIKVNKLEPTGKAKEIKK